MSFSINSRRYSKYWLEHIYADLTLCDKSGIPKLAKFIHNMHEAAVKNPNSQAGRLLAESVGYGEGFLERVDKLESVSSQEELDYKRYLLCKRLHANQYGVMLDINKHQSDSYILSQGRQYGKSHLVGVILASELIEPNTNVMYIHRSKGNAISNMWHLLLGLLDEIQEPVISSNVSLGEIVLANGSVAYIMGAPKGSDLADIFTGRHLKVCVFEEAWQNDRLEFLYETIIKPMYSIYENTYTIFSSTPPRTHVDYFWKLREQSRIFYGSRLDNPFIKDAAAQMRKVVESRPLGENDPLYRSEYLGEWVIDEEALVFQGFETYTLETDEEGLVRSDCLGFKPSSIVIGIDWGFRDYNSIITLAYSKEEQRAAVIRESKFNNATSSEIVRRIVGDYEAAVKVAVRYGISAKEVICHCDTNELSLAQEAQVNFGIPVFPAYKQNKMARVARLADDAATGRLVVPLGGPLAYEFSRLIFKRDGDHHILNELDDNSFHEDAVAALRYASVQMYRDFGFMQLG
jgi:hypothetical protein